MNTDLQSRVAAIRKSKTQEDYRSNVWAKIYRGMFLTAVCTVLLAVAVLVEDSGLRLTAIFFAFVALYAAVKAHSDSLEIVKDQDREYLFQSWDEAKSMDELLELGFPYLQNFEIQAHYLICPLCGQRQGEETFGNCEATFGRKCHFHDD